VALGYDDRMRDALLRQQVAITRLKLHGDALKHSLTTEVEHVVNDLSTKPEAFIASHPWKSAGGAFAAGFAIVPLVKAVFGHNIPQQKVVVEVRQTAQPAPAASASPAHTNGAVHHEKPSPWKPILDAAMQGLQSIGTVAAAKVVQNFQRRVNQNGNGNGNGDGDGNGNGHSYHNAGGEAEVFDLSGEAGGHFDEHSSAPPQGVDKKW